MKKNTSLISLILTIVLIIAVGFVTIVGIGETKQGSAGNIKLGLDLQGGVSITYEVVNEDFTEEDFNDTKRKLELRVSTYSTEAMVYKEGDNRITVDIPGEKDAEKVLEELGKPGSLQFVTSTGETDDPDTEEDESIKVWLEGSDIKNAQAETTSNSTTGKTEYVVSLTMTEEGTTKFAEATSTNVGKTMSILFDGKVKSSPSITKAIEGGRAEITGMNSLEEAEELASTIRIGSLKLELNDISHKVVGAQLGQDALELSVKAGIIGFIIVCIFMIFMYRISGVAASIALTLYVGLVLLTLNAFDLTLTLSGIAGIVLSIGMGVDANVIIYARIREEIADGKNVENAISVGFKKAASAIIDGNVTTIIAAVVLMWKGSGTVQGFAQTLAIGLILSVFTALVISRILAFAFYHIGFKSPNFYGKEKARKPINFVSKKNLFFIISAAVILGGTIFMSVSSLKGNGLFEYSVEFKGGRTLTANFDKAYTIDDFNDTIKPAIAEIIDSNDIQGQKVSDTNKFNIKTIELDDDVAAELKQMLINDFGASDEFDENAISASVSKEMTRDAIVAIIIAIICMLIYIWFRFKDIKFAVSGIMALAHDVLIVVIFYGVSRIAVGTTFIACILTILGYSINATIVIFDRIRENLTLMGKKDTIKDVVNLSITQTLTRSIYTSFTTFIMIAMIYFLGVPSIKDFALPLMVGVVIGAYSSVCMTGSLWYLFKTKIGKNKIK